MCKILENLQTLTDDIVRPLAFDVDDKADAARILLVLRVVEPLLRWKPWKFHVTYLVRKAGLFLPGGSLIERTQGMRNLVPREA
jgi:hypothetical protein